MDAPNRFRLERRRLRFQLNLHFSQRNHCLPCLSANFFARATSGHF
jgi:hypothetical protein